MTKILMWLIWNIPLGRMAPWIMGLALKRRPHKVEKNR